MDISTLTTILPTLINFLSMMKLISILAVAVLVIGALFRLILGRRSTVNRAVCSSIGTLCIYVLTIIIYAFRPVSPEQVLSPLPFITFTAENLHIIDFVATPFPSVCGEILSVIILILLYNLIDNLLPDGETTFSWLLLRSFSTVAALGAHYFVSKLTQEFLPALLVSYGPIILFSILIVTFLAGLLGALLSLVLTVLNPVLGFLFHFFFSSKLGKLLSRAVLSAGLLTGAVVALNRFGYIIIAVTPAALVSYIPLFLVLIALWWLLERIF